MKVLIVGATGGTGRALVDELLARGHEVTAFARRAGALEIDSPRFRLAVGDALNPADLSEAVRGQDAVAVTLGIRENPLMVRLRGTSSTALDIRSLGTKNVIAAMQEHGVDKLVVQTTYGVGATEGRLPLKWNLIFNLLLKPQIADTEVQEQVVRKSGLDWTLVQPVGLTDTEVEEPAISIEGDAPRMNVSRKTVAQLLSDALESSKYRRESVAISAAA